MNNEGSEERYSRGRRYTSMNWEREDLNKKDTKTKRKIIFGIFIITVLSISGAFYLIFHPSTHTEDFSVIIHLDSKEKLREFEPIRITDQFITSSEDEWHVYHYFLLFSEDFLYKGDIEGVTVLTREHAEDVVVAYWQYGWLVIKKYDKEDLRGKLHVYLECGMHTALPEPGDAAETAEGMPLSLEETTLLSLLKNLGYDVPPFGSTDGKIVVDVDWKDVTLEEGIHRMEAWLEEKGASGTPRTLRLEPLKSFSNSTNYYYLMDPSNEILDIRSTFAPGEIQSRGVIPSQLIYVSENVDFTEEGSQLIFQYVLRTKEAAPGQKREDTGSSEAASLIYFLTGLTLPNDAFWVNLNPSEPETIIDSNLGSTMIGKIMLEADFQMKKDFCKYENPCNSSVGEMYWDLLEKKREELVRNCMKRYPEILSIDNVFFSFAIRYWIIPGKITAYGDGDELYIIDAKLNIQSEYESDFSDFKIVNQSNSVSKDCYRSLNEAKKEYGEYAQRLGDELILPLVVREVNTNDQYAGLRQVYVSLALAQWYKSHAQQESLFSGFMDSGNTGDLVSWVKWDPKGIWEDYVRSINGDEEECHCERTQENVIWIYTGGGIKFSDSISQLEICASINEKILSETPNEILFHGKIFIEERKKRELGNQINNYYRPLIILPIITFHRDMGEKETMYEYRALEILVCILSVFIADERISRHKRELKPIRLAKDKR